MGVCICRTIGNVGLLLFIVSSYLFTKTMSEIFYAGAPFLKDIKENDSDNINLEAAQILYRDGTSSHQAPIAVNPH